MPYVAIKSFPKDDKTVRELVERINQVVMDVVGCPQEAVTISVDHIAPEAWEEEVKNADILPNKDKMMILSGKKLYES